MQSSIALHHRIRKAWPVSLVDRVLAVLIGSVAVVAASWLLLGAYFWFTWRPWAWGDYGIYTNMLWNTGHGAPFLYGDGRSYLVTHLSFSLAPYGLLYRIWDHPLVLMYVQWAGFAAGAILLCRSASRARIPVLPLAALLLFYTTYPFTQSVLLSPFHGVSQYFFLLPWLYFCASYARKWTLVPLLLLLALREDAFLNALPILLYIAVRDRWRAGYVYAAASFLYGVLAIFVLYPWINGISVFAYRKMEVSTDAMATLASAEGWLPRARPIFWALAPALLAGGRRAGVILLLSAVPFIVNLSSGYKTQNMMTSHYPAALMACLSVGVLAAFSHRPPTGMTTSLRVRSILLVALTIAAHLGDGFLALGGHAQRETYRSHPEGIRTLATAQAIPRDGHLVAPWHLAGVCANRRHILAGLYYNHRRHRADLVFCRLKDLKDAEKGMKYRSLLVAQTHGVEKFDGEFVLLRRGASTARNAEVLAAYDRATRTVYASKAHHRAGVVIRTADGQELLHWPGGDSGDGPALVFGRSIPCPPGSYRATLTYESGSPAQEDAPGTFAIKDPLGIRVMATTNLASASSRKAYTATLDFTLTETNSVEPVVTAGRAELWLDRIVLDPLPAP